MRLRYLVAIRGFAMASLVWISVFVSLTTPALGDSGDEHEHFENKIRPVLIERCYGCHNSTSKSKGGLALDSRESLRRGGGSGAAIVAGDPDSSLLIESLRHDDDLAMPKGGPKLDDRVIADFVKWIEDGAPDPRDRAPTADELKQVASWEAIRRKRQEWWSFQSITRPTVPEPKRAGAMDSDIDRFVLASLEANALERASRADRRTLIRRVSFALTGLPPTVDEVDAFVSDPSPSAYEKVVERQLDSPQFGERWARHWMDWFRYADSHGSEGDPSIPHAWRYRDYLIRALNADISYDQLLREHVAGDLITQPRINEELGIIESVVGASQFRFVQHGFAPTDALEEQARFIDNQIDVLSKAILGLTVSCARCHDHKFDAIGQTDFYALYGVLASCRPALVVIDTPDRLATHREELTAVKAKIKSGLADAWLRATSAAPGDLLELASDSKRLASALKNSESPLHAWARTTSVQPHDFERVWADLTDRWRQSRKHLEAEREREYPRRWRLATDDYLSWIANGNGIRRSAVAGGFHVLPEGDRVIQTLLPAGAYSHLLSSKHNGWFASPSFEFSVDSIYVRVAGRGGSRARYVVQNYPRQGTVYPVHAMRDGVLRWVRWDANYWEGDRGHIEVSTAADQAVEVDTGADRSWFGITDVVLVTKEQAKAGQTPRNHSAEFVAPLFEAAMNDPPTTRAELAELYRVSLRRCIERWRSGSLSDAGARYLGAFVSEGLLPATLNRLPTLVELVADYRGLESEVGVPRRAPGVFEALPRDQPLFVRGDHRQPGDIVPPRFLEAIDAKPYSGARSARLQLADDLIREDNPFVARVAVNRLWHHTFGRGLVPSTDNFGKLGDRPTHPELLDYLASEFRESGWSIKRMLRRFVTSETFRAGSRASVAARELDPTNRYLSHFDVRRLDAEAIRDSLLAVSGQLDPKMFGPSVVGRSDRRSVYKRVQRNRLDPFLAAFDAPEPHTTQGRRDSTNVPAQSLMLLNDPFVRDQARAWAATVIADPALEDGPARIRQMFLSAFGRGPTDRELAIANEFISRFTRESEALQSRVAHLQLERQRIRSQLSSIRVPIRERIEERSNSRGRSSPPGPDPIAAWEFDGDLKDSVGQLHGRGEYRFEGGALLLDGNTHAVTGPIGRDLTEKTLEVWVQLDGLDQRAGGVMSVETRGGQVFDAIVFAEQASGEWLPGSDNFRRTQSLAGPKETEAGHRPVQVAISYEKDGTITAYRDGVPYGRAYQSSGPIRFTSGEAVVLFGLRHSPAHPGKRIRGRIHRARLYDRALGAAEIAASAGVEPTFVSESQLVEAMTDPEREAYESLNRELSETDAAWAKLDLPDGYQSSELAVWQGFAQSLFSFKEFIYLR